MNISKERLMLITKVERATEQELLRMMRVTGKVRVRVFRTGRYPLKREWYVIRNRRNVYGAWSFRKLLQKCILGIGREFKGSLAEKRWVE